MRELAERIAVKVESLYCGLIAIHTELIQAVEKALIEEYSAVTVFNAINAIYPTKSLPAIYLINIIAEEMEERG